VREPWTEFVARARGGRVAGYFERGRALDARGEWATWFTDADEVVRVTSPRDVGALDRIDDALRRHPSASAVGYLGFDAASLFEPLIDPSVDGSPFPLGEFAIVRGLRRRPVPAGPRREGARAAPDDATTPPPPRSDTLPAADYRRSVRRLRVAIRNGEAFQVVLGHRREHRRPDDLIDRAGRLRARERYAYFFYLQFEDRAVVGASPESVLEVDRRSAVLHPIAGTRPRPGRSRTVRRSLRRDPKELAEHRMLVDLARNDLGRIAEPGSVRVPWTERVVRFRRLEHLVSCVSARLPRGASPWAALGAAFPAGTVSGAPKIRATRLLRAEERSWRGPYAGTVGLLEGRDRATWALTIRSAFAARDRLYTAAGAGVVWGSTPAREYAETLAKLAEVEASLLVPPEGP
jgi:anthranilate/para-aminobenzoate synthase component I